MQPTRGSARNADDESVSRPPASRSRQRPDETTKTPYTRTTISTADARKLRKNSRERARRHDLKYLFDSLSDILNLSSRGKPEKYSVLNEAITTITKLREDLDHANKVIEDLTITIEKQSNHVQMSHPFLLQQSQANMLNLNVAPDAASPHQATINSLSANNFSPSNFNAVLNYNYNQLNAISNASSNSMSHQKNLGSQTLGLNRNLLPNTISSGNPSLNSGNANSRPTTDFSPMNSTGHSAKTVFVFADNPLPSSNQFSSPSNSGSTFNGVNSSLSMNGFNHVHGQNSMGFNPNTSHTVSSMNNSVNTMHNMGNGSGNGNNNNINVAISQQFPVTNQSTATGSLNNSTYSNTLPTSSSQASSQSLPNSTSGMASGTSGTLSSAHLQPLHTTSFTTNTKLQIDSSEIPSSETSASNSPTSVPMPSNVVPSSLSIGSAGTSSTSNGQQSQLNIPASLMMSLPSVSNPPTPRNNTIHSSNNLNEMNGSSLNTITSTDSSNGNGNGNGNSNHSHLNHHTLLGLSNGVSSNGLTVGMNMSLGFPGSNNHALGAHHNSLHVRANSTDQSGLFSSHPVLSPFGAGSMNNSYFKVPPSPSNGIGMSGLHFGLATLHAQTPSNLANSTLTSPTAIQSKLFFASGTPSSKSMMLGLGTIGLSSLNSASAIANQTQSSNVDSLGTSHTHTHTHTSNTGTNSNSSNTTLAMSQLSLAANGGLPTATSPTYAGSTMKTGASSIFGPTGFNSVPASSDMGLGDDMLASPAGFQRMSDIAEANEA